MNTVQNRLKSKAAWASVGALLLLVGDSFGLWNVVGITSGTARAIIDAVLAAAAAFGIFNDPTNKTGF